jgi:ABC-2 type transport system permease protein
MASEIAVQGAPEAGSGAATGWLIVAQEEARSLWLEGRALTLLFGLSVLLSVLSYLVATNGELSLLSQQETVNLTIQVAVTVGVVVVMLTAANTLSGERESGTLETLILTPVPRRQLALGKLLAALSLWPAVLAIGMPYWWVLTKGPGTFWDAAFTATVVGTLLAITFGCLGIIVSALASNNRTSLSVTFFVFVALLAPTQLPGSALKGWLGDAINRANPMTAGAKYIDTIVIDNHSWTQDISWLISPAVAVVIAVIAAFILTARLRLHGGIRG